jgi:hypothetical protein
LPQSTVFKYSMLLMWDSRLSCLSESISEGVKSVVFVDVFCFSLGEVPNSATGNVEFLKDVCEFFFIVFPC